MGVLWAGGEDIDFPTIGGFVPNTSTASAFRAGWARCSLFGSSAQFAMSAAFPGGAVTTAWFSGRFYLNSPTQNATMFGVGTVGTRNLLGVGIDATNASKLVLIKFDGTTRTVLATETGASLSTTLFRIDMQVTSYGATATVNVYVNGVSVITFSGDVRAGGATSFNAVFIQSPAFNNYYYSEMFVSDTDTRSIQGVQTLALTGAGTTNGWTNNTFSNINAVIASDNSPASVNTTGTDQQYTVTAPTPASYTVAAISISARMAKSSASVPTNVKLGYGNGATGAFGTGASKAVTTGYQDYQQLDLINPVTGVAFTSSDLASLQLCVESA